MKRFLPVALLCSLLLMPVLFSSCGGNGESSAAEQSRASSEASAVSGDDPGSVSEEQSAAPREPVDVLFVGNSFTFYNDMPETFASVAQSAGIPVRVTAVTFESARLEWFYDAGRSISKTLSEALEQAEFEIAFLQEHSTRPYKQYASFSAAAAKLSDLIGKSSPDCRIFLYETWGFAEDNGTVQSEGMTTGSQEKLLLDAYENAGKECGLSVSYVGISMYRLYKDTAIDPYAKDRKHPSPAGSFLAALTHFYTVFPETEKDAVTFRGELDEETFASLKDAAYATAHDESVLAAFRSEFGD